MLILLRGIAGSLVGKVSSDQEFYGGRCERGNIAGYLTGWMLGHRASVSQLTLSLVQSVT